MRHRLEAALAREICDPAGNRESAAAREVGLEHVDVTLLDEPAVRREAGVGLAGGDPDAHRVGKPAEAVVVVRRERLLEPVDVELVDALDERDCALHGVSHAAVDHQRAPGTEHRPRGGEQLDVAVQVLPERSPAELERAVAVGDGPLGDRADLVRGLRHHLARVDGDLVGARDAQQVVHGPTGRLAGNVPQRHVDRADHVKRNARTAVVVGGPVQELPEPVDLERVLADEHLAQAPRDQVRRRHVDHRPCEVGRRVCFADAHVAIVGVDPNEEGVLSAVGARGVDAVRAEDDRLDGGDLQRVTAPSACAISARTSPAASSSCASVVRCASAATLTAPAGRAGWSRKSGKAMQLIPSSLSSSSSA